MELILLLCAAAVAGYLIWRKGRRGGDLPAHQSAAPPAVRAAAKRLGFRAPSNAHTIAGLHSSELCIAAMARAFAQMDPEAEVPDLAPALQKRLGLGAQDAADLNTFAPWVVEQGGGPTPAFERLTKRLKQLDHGTDFDKLMRVLGDVTAAGTKGMPTAPQADAMGALARIFRTA